MAVIKVGIADLNVAAYPDTITTLGLGSCVGVTLYDSTTKIAGLAHVMLPSTELSKTAVVNKAKFADSALPELVDRMLKKGAVARRIKAKMAGGAQMFQFKDSTGQKSIGDRNIEACKMALRKLGIPLVAEDVGGNYGRTIELFTETGMLEVRAISKDIKHI
ncbi:chemotaxis protein CheD [Heliorestis acidaminivorans]|uniref:Probable chemoreceptor glutamine deamidase CheD n=1 Tax=Heliorestis acidaminivorans TaxID=553427 RepID=A0A6I0EZQ8_9FIRM|nr:chemotaxis protein CheD [Heliorestis acidaminivorans]KAB2952985.1 chemotaxis protein CheD [Heliorestis acidaminivorans]